MVSRPFLSWRLGLFVVLTAVLAGCGSPPPVAETPPAPVSVSQPVAREVIDEDDYEGRLAAVDLVEVRARVRGHLVKINFQDGQLVTEKDPLFEIDPRPYKNALDAATAQLSAADAGLELAKGEYARIIKVATSGSASQEEVQIWKAKQLTAAADRLKALAALEQAKLDLDFTKVFAPISGKISRAQVTVGNLVNAGGGETLLTTIASVDPIYVYFDVDERAMLRYRQVYRKPSTDGSAEPTLKDLKIPVYAALEGEQGYPNKGVLDFSDNRVNPGTGTIQVRGVLPNKKGHLDSGMRARVRVPVGDPHKALMVTERAIGSDQGKKFVYVVNAQNVVERRDVVLDRLSEGLQVIREGLKPDDWVIVNGIQRVRDGAKVEPKRVAMPGAPADATKQEPKS